METLDAAFVETRRAGADAASVPSLPWCPQVSRASLPTLEEALDTYAGSLVRVDRLLGSLLETASPATLLLATCVIVEQLEDPELLLSLFSTVFATLGDTEAHQRLLPCIAPLTEILPSAEPGAALSESSLSPTPLTTSPSPPSPPTPPSSSSTSPSSSASSSCSAPLSSSSSSSPSAALSSSSPLVPFGALETRPSACMVDAAVSFLSRLSSLPLARSRCGQVWDGEHVAYRCLTCGGSQSSCICVFCFQEGNHLGHSYFIYRSSCGGCCDCGDASAWAPSGFCRHHPGGRRDVDPSLALPAVSKFALALLLRVLVRRLAMHALEKNWTATEELCTTLLQLSEQHEGVRRCLGQAMLEAVRGTPDDSRGFACEEIPGRDRLRLPPNYARYDGCQSLLLNPALLAPAGGGAAWVSEEEELDRRAAEGASRAAEAQAKAAGGASSLGGAEGEHRMRMATERELREINERKRHGGVNVKAFDDALRFAMWGGAAANAETNDAPFTGSRGLATDAQVRKREDRRDSGHDEKRKGETPNGQTGHIHHEMP
ncbi:zinc finger in N-recognin, partial [Toxoplasma gondii MAS]